MQRSLAHSPQVRFNRREGSNELQNILEQPIPCTQGRYLGPIKVLKEISASPLFAQRTHPSFRCLLFVTTEQDQAHTSLFRVQNDVVLVLLLFWAHVGDGLLDTSLFPIVHPSSRSCCCSSEPPEREINCAETNSTHTNSPWKPALPAL